MNEVKHTPSPWETLTFSNHELQTDFAMVKIGCRVHKIGYSVEDWANARLIAASPTMYEYINQRANEGDAHAAKIIASI